jgi:LPS sulfotransferase NodH
MNRIDSAVPRNRITKFLFGIYNQYLAYMASFLPFRTTKTRFIIFGQGRTGSTLLVKLLNDHPEILCEREIFQKKNNLGDGKIANPFRMLAGKTKLFHRRVYGFKAKIYQIELHCDPGSFLNDLYQKGWKIIYLKRRNLFDHILSSIVAESLETYHFSNSADKSKYQDLKITLDKKDLFRRLDERREFLKQEAKVLEHISYHQVEYEDLSTNTQEEISKIFSFLSLSDFKVPVRLQKSNTRKYEDLIDNFDEVKLFLNQTEYAEFLD